MDRTGDTGTAIQNNGNIKEDQKLAKNKDAMTKLFDGLDHPLSGPEHRKDFSPELGELVVPLLAAAAISGGSAPFNLTLVQTTMAALGESEDFAAQAYDALKPRDGFETLLVGQIIQVQAHMQTASVRLRDADTLDKMAAYERIFSKMTKTYAMQMETLRKHRNGGVQTVKHVHVNEGGQAIVADQINHGGG